MRGLRRRKKQGVARARLLAPGSVSPDEEERYIVVTFFRDSWLSNKTFEVLPSTGAGGIWLP